MYAIVEIAGQQFKVEKEQEIFVHRLENEIGSSVVFDKVLLIEDDGKIKIGKPSLQDAGVSASILSHEKGDKVLVFHKKNRKGYRKLNGHRQYFSKIQILDIAEDKTILKTEVAAVIEKPIKAKKVAAKKVVEEVAEKPVKKASAKASAKKEAVPAEEKKVAKTTKKTTKEKKEE